MNIETSHRTDLLGSGAGGSTFSLLRKDQ